MPDRPTKITFGEMRDSGVRGILVYCADHRCSHSIAISGDSWPDDVRLSDIEHRFVSEVCGKRGADVRPASTEQTVICPIPKKFNLREWLVPPILLPIFLGLVGAGAVIIQWCLG